MSNITSDSPESPAPGRVIDTDVAILGGGLAGLATAMRLAGRGWRTLCVEPRPWPREAVGESLEFSTPRLLSDLGLGPDELAENGLAFPKNAVDITTSDDSFTVWPPAWFGRAPIWCAGHTFHVDRAALDQRVMELAVERGVDILQDRATNVHCETGRVAAAETKGGHRIRARWFVDATGHRCQLLGRALNLERIGLGDDRIAYWCRLDLEPSSHATQLRFGDATARDLSWGWEIPLNSDQVSVGAVMPAKLVRDARRQGMTPRQLFEAELVSSPRLHAAVTKQTGVKLHSTSYGAYRYRRPVGTNWILVGEASTLADPLTSNGVTSALRHAQLAANLVDNALIRGSVRDRERWLYTHTVSDVVAALDLAIERFVYAPKVRRRVGMRAAVNLYAATGVVMNSLYAKIDPVTMPKGIGAAAMLAGQRAWIRAGSFAFSLGAPT